MAGLRPLLSVLAWALVQQACGSVVQKDEAAWKVILQRSEKVQESVYSMTLNMFMIAGEYNETASRAALSQEVVDFDSLLGALTGDSPHQTVTDTLSSISSGWDDLKALLLAVPASGTPVTTQSLQDAVSKVNVIVALGKQLSILVSSLAEQQDVQFSTLGVTTALNQLMLTKKMMMLTLSIHQDVDKSQALAELSESYETFSNAMTGLLDGMPFVGLLPTINKCTLQAMGRVSDSWTKLRSSFNIIFLLETVESEQARNEVVEEATGLVQLVQAAALLYINPESVCPIILSDIEYINLIETSSVQAMYAQKIGRLFLQAAKRVNTLDSRVLISDSIVGGTSRMGLVRAGSSALQIPPPITQDVANIYATMWDQWTQFTTLLADNVQTVSLSDTAILKSVEEQSMGFFANAMKALDIIEAECVAKATSVPCTLLRKLGRQRVLLQKMSFEASLQAVGADMETNRERMLNSTIEFDTAMGELLHGDGQDLGRTQHYCQIMKLKDIQDEWYPLRTKMMTVAGDAVGTGDYTVDRIFSIDTSQWKAGVDPFFKVITETLGTYLTTPDDDLCKTTQQGNGVTQAQWEAAVRASGMLRAQIEKVSAEYYLIVKGETLADYEGTIAETQAMITHLIGGWSADNIPSAPTQTIANRLFDIEDGETNMNNGWTDYKALLKQATRSVTSDVIAVSTKGERLMFNLGYALEAYIDAAWTANENVPGERTAVITMQSTLVERMLKDSLLLSLSQAGAAGDILDSINQFDTDLIDLRDGNGRDNKYLIPKATEDEHLEALANITKDWANLKPILKNVADRGSAGTSDLQSIRSLVIKLSRTLEPAVALFSTMTVITTKIPINLMIPLPFTGKWTPGNTMKLATEIAQDIINEQQTMLPNYRIFSSFFDDACDADTANRFMLKEFASSTAWVGVGGMACSVVCESLAVVTASLFLPTISFDCSEGQSLSNQELFPSFIRLGTQRGRIANVLDVVGALIPYARQVTILSSNAVEELVKVEGFQAQLSLAGVASAALSATESDMTSINDMMAMVKSQKERFLYFQGGEAFYRRVLCASGRADTPIGSTWISEGVKSKAWWAQDDSSLIADVPACDGEYVKARYQGALSVLGLAYADASARDVALDCYNDYTPQTLHDHVLTQLAAGYPAGDPNRTIVTHPHVELINFALDGMCAFTKTIRFMLQQGHAIEDLRTPSSDVFSQAIRYMKDTLTFSGTTGMFDIGGNDLPHKLAIWQADGAGQNLAGSLDSTGTVVFSLDGQLNSALWSEAPPDPIVEMTAANWISTFESASVQEMFGQKMTRLFLQAAQGVNLLDSRVLFSDARVNARAAMLTLLEGSTRLDIPQKWFSETIHQDLLAVNFLLEHQQGALSENVYTVTTADQNLIADAANESALLYELSQTLIDRIVEDCDTRSGQNGAEEVPCHIIQKLGLQRVLLQKMSLEAALQGALYEVDHYKEVMINTSVQYEQAHFALVHGLPPHIPRTADHCILQQMKVVHDEWLPFKEKLVDIYTNGASMEVVFSVDTSQWKAGVDPMFAQITDALQSYTTGSGTCTQVGENKPNQKQLEAALRKVGFLGELSQRVAKDYLYIVKGLTANLEEHVNLFEGTLMQLISGWTPSFLPAPPEQSIVDALYAVMDGDSGLSNGWPAFKTALLKAKLGVSSDVTDIDTLSRAVMTKTQDLMGRYIDSAWVLDQKVPGSRAELAFGQLTLVQRMCKEAALISLNRGDSDQLRGTISAYESNHAQILEGNGNTGKRGIVKTTEDSHQDAMAIAQTAWNVLKTNVQRVANDGSATTGRLETIDVDSQVLRKNLEMAADLYGTETIITTKIPVNIMVPLPLTGRWAPGPTLRVAAEIARDIINEQQIMLPGYRIFTTFFDDECDIDKANRAMLSNYAGDDSWIGVAGMGCSIVCESLSVITASLFLPTLSFECSEGSALSNVELFPDFMRLGTPRTRTSDILIELKKSMAWWETLAIISGNVVVDLDSAASMQASLAADGLLSHTASSDEGSFSETQAMMDKLKRDKSRVVFFIGTESFYRQALCAAMEADTPVGVAWLSEGVRQKGWWTLIESNLLLHQSCTTSSISEIYQGAVAMTGLGKPRTETGAALDCFDTYTASTLMDYVLDALANGYPADSPNKTAIAAPHVQVTNFALDGMCTFAMMVKHMVFEQNHDMEELRTPSPEIFAKSTNFMKKTMDFSGASGRVQFSGNDLPGDIALWQAVGNESVLAGLAGQSGAVEITLDTKYWSEAPPDPVIPMTAENWMQTIEAASVLMMYAQKAPRLFLQAAQGVNQLDSRVLFSDSRVQTNARFEQLLDGSVRYKIPSKWFTAAIQQIYLESSSVWNTLSDMMAANIGTADRNSAELIDQAASLSETVLTMSQSGMDDIIADCHAREAETTQNVPCTVLRVLGNQRVLIQKMSKEANLQGLGHETEINRNKMVASWEQYEVAHHDLVHGKAPYIPRTTEHCILQQMKKVHDEWLPFYDKLDAVYKGNLGEQTLLALDQAQWKAGVDPMFRTISEAVESYRKGEGTCTQICTLEKQDCVSREQFEAAIRTGGKLRELVKQMSKEYFFVVKGLSTNLAATIAEFEEMLEHIISGWTPDTLPAPPSQPVADALLGILDGDTGAANGWLSYRGLLENAQVNQQSSVVKLSQTSASMLDFVNDAVVEYINVAWDQNREVPGSRSNLASSQAVLVQKMVEEALLITLSQSGARGALASSVDQFDQNHLIMMNGNGMVGKDEVPPTTEDTHEDILATVGREWNTFKPLVKQVSDSGYATASQLENIQLSSNNLAKELTTARTLFSTMTRTTTKIPVNFMILLPFSGRWAPGETMRIATSIAQDLINEQQKLLSGYRIFAEFFDDGCDADVANRRMLEQFAGNEKWVGVGGMGCTPVCESLAVITASLFLPTMSFECSSGSDLSETSLFPNFLRFGTARNRLLDIFVKLRTFMSWWDEMGIVGSDMVSDTDRAAELNADMLSRNLLSSASSANEDDFDALKAVMQTLKQQKRRVIYFIGTESFFRKVICAARAVDTPIGVAWLSEGVKSRGWWMHDDAQLLATQSGVVVTQGTHSGCGGAAIGETYDGGVNIAGLGYQQSTNNAALDCFDDYTAAELNAYVKQHLAQGYPAGHPNATTVAAPHEELINFALDGVCAFALMVKHMLDKDLPIADLRTPTQDIYSDAVSYLRNTMDFTGASGRVHFSGNDLPGYNALWQAIGSELVLAGLARTDLSDSVSTTGLSTSHWSQAPPDPIIPMTAENWMNTIEQSNVMIVFAEKAARLFFQAAQKVNTLDSRVLFSDSRVQALARLDIMLHGSVRENIPEKWFSAEVKEQLDEIYTQWQSLELLLSNNIGTVDLSDVGLIADVAARSEQLYDVSTAALDMVVEMCHSRDSTVPCTVLRVAGRQRALLQKMSKEAMLQGTHTNVQHNKQRMQATSDLFEQSHYDLIHGKMPSIPRTSDYCILQQMKDVHDEWGPFKEKIHEVYLGDASNEMLFQIDTSQWKAGVDPLFSVITEALESYARGSGGTCTQVSNGFELEAAIAMVGFISEMTQTLAKEYMFVVKGLPTTLTESLEQFRVALSRLVSGWKNWDLPSPPTQDVANSLFAIQDGDIGQNNGWPGYKAMLAGAEAGVSNFLSEVEANSQSILAKAEDAMAMYIDAAWNLDEDVPGTRSSTSSGQLMLIQKMSKEAALVSLGRSDRGNQLLATIGRFESNHAVLLAGNSNAGKRNMPPTTEQTHLDAMDEVMIAWESFEPHVRGIAESGYASTSTLELVAAGGDNMKLKMEVANNLYRTKTVTTTKKTIDIMLPLPMTGIWSPGPTMKMVTQIAIDLINEQQELLPAYRVVAEFFDDQCDPDVATRRMLEQFAAKSDWIGMGGMACSSVCEVLAVITSSLFLPTVSFECSDGATLSKPELFPAFMRLGTRRLSTPTILNEISKGVAWWTNSPVAVLSSDRKEDIERANMMTTDLDGTSHATSVAWASLTSMMDEMKLGKRRIIFWVGSETNYRRVICASGAVQTPQGITWISDGIKAANWWTVDDSQLRFTFPSQTSMCTGEWIASQYRGAVSITGLGRPSAEHYGELARSHTAECFSEYNLETLGNYIKQQLADGYEGLEPVLNPHEELINFALDGVCAMTMTVRHMFTVGFSLDQLRTPAEDVYLSVIDYMRNVMSFQGMSGQVNFVGNDLPGEIAVWQVVVTQGHPLGELRLAGITRRDGTTEVPLTSIDPARLDRGGNYGQKLTSFYWAAAPPDPIIDMTIENWQNVIEASTVLNMAMQKANRLFLQAALRVNTLDSRVLFSDARVGTRGRMENLRIGNEMVGIPIKWYTPTVRAQFDVMWAQWNVLEVTLANNVQTVGAGDTVLLRTTDTETKDLISKSETALDEVVEECKKRTIEEGLLVACEALRLLGNQAALLQKMDREAVLQGLSIDIDHNRMLMMEDVHRFDEAHLSLVHGAVAIKRTEDYCLLQQFKDIHDAWRPFKAVLETVNQGQRDAATLLKLDGAQWSAGVDPMFKVIADTLHAYQQQNASGLIPGGRTMGICTHVGEKNATRQELEEAIKQVGALGEMAQRFAKERFMYEKFVELDEDPSGMNMTHWSVFQNSFMQLISGWTDSGLPAPPSQRVVNTLLAIEDGGWAEFRDHLHMGTGTSDDIRKLSDTVADLCHTAVTAYVSAAEVMNTDVPGARSAQVSSLYAILQEVLKNAAYMSLTGKDYSKTIKGLQDQFEEDLGKLASARRLQAATEAEDAEVEHRNALSELRGQWDMLTPVINRVASAAPDADRTLAGLINISTYAARVDQSMQATTVLYSVMTQTTTKTPVHIMLPLPLSGHSAPGMTMEVAAKLAESLINEEQLLLPGYNLRLNVFDDNCDADWAMREMLQKYAESNSWVAVGGMACTAVCEQIAIISSALWLPALGFECSEGDKLSNTELYPDFMRLGTRRLGMYGTLNSLKLQFGWNDIVIVAAPDAINEEAAASLACELDGKVQCDDERRYRDAVFPKIRTETIVLGATDDTEQRMQDQFGSARDIMNTIMAAKERLIYFIGPERQFRYLLCASHYAGVHPGLTWVSEGVKGRSWWVEEDDALLAAYPECTPQRLTELFEGSINIAGLGEPLERDMDAELDCFRDHTSRTIYEHVRNTLEEGYPTSPTRLNPLGRNATPILHPHDHLVNFAVDGVCMLAMAVQRMIFKEMFTIQELQKPHQEQRFQRVIGFMRNRLDFQGASGRVRMTGNDREGYLAAWQASGNSSKLVGHILAERTNFEGIWLESSAVNLSWATGLQNGSWEVAPDDVLPPEEDPFPILAVVIPVLVLFFMAICCYAIYSSKKTGGSREKGEA